MQVSNNWGGTTVQSWSSASQLKKCNATAASGTDLYNPMIHPYTVGPMRFKGAIWHVPASVFWFPFRLWTAGPTPNPTLTLTLTLTQHHELYHTRTGTRASQTLAQRRTTRASTRL